MTQTIKWTYPGARWWKFDFHTHTPASLDTHAWQKAIGTPEEITPEKWLLQYMAAGVDCVAITDHNSGAWIDKLKKAYADLAENPPEGFREIFIFPGVEISVNGGFHLLAIFDLDTSTSDIDTLLGNVKYDKAKGDSNGVTIQSGKEVIESIMAAGGIPIPAHVDQEKGLLQFRDDKLKKTILDANSIVQIFKFEAILAMERINKDIPLPGIYTEHQVQWAEVAGSDCHNFQGEAIPGSRYTWVKMSNPSLEGLRLALLDGNDISLRRWDDTGFTPFQLPDHFIEEIAIKQARFLGISKPETIRLSPYLNALIGGRGTGKSTIIHMLRIAFNRQSELDGFDEKSEPRHTFDQFNLVPKSRFDKGGLRKEMTINTIFVREGIRHNLQWEKENESTSVSEWDGEGWTDSISQSITSERFPLRIFSQGQIAQMAVENRQGLLQVIDETANLQTLKQAYEKEKSTYFSLRAQLRDYDARLLGTEEVSRRLQDVSRKIEKFENSQYREIYQAFQDARAQNTEVTNRIDAFEKLVQRIQEFSNKVEVNEINKELFNTEADTDLLNNLDLLKDLVNTIRQTVEKLPEEMNVLLQSVRDDSSLHKWRERIQVKEEEYEKLKESLVAQGIKDQDQYDAFLIEKENLQNQLTDLSKLEAEKAGLILNLEEQKKRILAARTVITEARKDFLETNLKNNLYVHIDVDPFGYDPLVIEDSLRECIDITDERFSGDILVVENDKPKSGLVADFLQNKDRLDEIEKIKIKISSNDENFGGKFRTHLANKLKNQPEFLDRLETWYPEDDLRIRYSRKGDGKDFQPIALGSAGQRAAAILAFLLAFGREPLVLDQPEDDLDNQLIYDLVVQQIRVNKLRRQLIIVTHNPNIVVNGDAEMIYAFDFSGQCYVRERGALQEKLVREDVCRVMEGGRDAFKRRWHRLGKEI